MEPIARIQGVLPSAPRAAGRSSSATEGPERPSPQTSLAVIPIAAADGRSRVTGRPAAAFLAHLIATAAQMPQTRERRRAEPDAAAAVYAFASRVSGGSIGTICVRDI
jgi:hypothetical protein